MTYQMLLLQLFESETERIEKAHNVSSWTWHWRSSFLILTTRRLIILSKNDSAPTKTLFCYTYLKAVVVVEQNPKKKSKIISKILIDICSKISNPKISERAFGWLSRIRIAKNAEEEEKKN